MLKALILTAISCLLNIGAPIVNSSVALNVYEQQSEYIELEKAKEKLVSYDDENYEITLNADELNNYTFNNLSHYLYANYTNITTIISSFTYDEEIYTFSDSYIFEDDGDVYINYSFNDTQYIEFSSDDHVDNINEFRFNSDDEYIDFSLDVYLLTNQSYYAGIKQAIEADILANTPSENMPSISDIFTEIATAITNFVTTLASAFNGVTTLFWDASANGNAGGFTFLGVLVLIGCGVGLVYGAYRIIKGLMHRV